MKETKDDFILEINKMLQKTDNISIVIYIYKLLHESASN